MNWIRHAVWILIFFVIQGCALLGSDDDTPTKSKSIRFQAPESPFQKLSVSSADAVWQSSKTGNTISMNSTCQKYENLPLDTLRENILAGIEDLKIQQKQEIQFNQRKAQRVSASGSMDGVPVSIDLLVMNKDSCTYDFTFIGRKKSQEKEAQIFEKFLNKVEIQ